MYTQKHRPIEAVLGASKLPWTRAPFLECFNYPWNRSGVRRVLGNARDEYGGRKSRVAQRVHVSICRLNSLGLDCHCLVGSWHLKTWAPITADSEARRQSVELYWSSFSTMFDFRLTCRAFARIKRINTWSYGAVKICYPVSQLYPRPRETMLFIR